MRAAVAMFAAGSLWGACLVPSGPRIVAGDLAAAIPAFAAADPGAPVAFAPMAGVRRTLSAAELERAARSAGIELAGARAACFEWPLAPVANDRIVAALRRAVGDPQAEVEIMERFREPAPEGPLELAAGPSAPLWRGSIRYGGGEFRLWVRARVRTLRPQVVALEPLEARRPIRAGQVAVREERVEAFDRDSATEIEQVIGRIPRVPLAAGSAIALSRLDRANDVDRGDLVKLRAADPGATITTQATAEGSGRRGDTIVVRNTSSGKLIRARIEDRGLVVLTAGGGIH